MSVQPASKIGKGDDEKVNNRAFAADTRNIVFVRPGIRNSCVHDKTNRISRGRDRVAKGLRHAVLNGTSETHPGTALRCLETQPLSQYSAAL